MKYLVSVQNASEAELALQAGVDYVDLKDPSSGALGSVDPATVSQTLEVQRDLRRNDSFGVKPSDSKLSMACGEWSDDFVEVPAGIRLAKLGTSGWKSDPESWGKRWSDWTGQLPLECRAVLVAYADFEHCQGMSPEEAIQHASVNGQSNVLIDTNDKALPGLFGLLTDAEAVIGRWIQKAKDGGVELALAGKLTLDQIEILRKMDADTVGVRSAVCRGDRTGQLDPEKLRLLGDSIRRSKKMCSNGN